MNRRNFMRSAATILTVPLAATAITSTNAEPPTQSSAEWKISPELLRDMKHQELVAWIRADVARGMARAEARYWENWENKIVYGNPGAPEPAGILTHGTSNGDYMRQ